MERLKYGIVFGSKIAMIISSVVNKSIMSSVATGAFGVFYYSIKLLLERLFNIITYDPDFVVIWFIFIVFDSGLGLLKHYRTHTIDMMDFSLGMATKVFSSWVIMFFFNSIMTLPDIQANDYILGGVKYFAYFCTIGVLSKSILNNIFILSNGTLPPKAFMKIFNDFQETMDWTKLFNEIKINKHNEVLNRIDDVRRNREDFNSNDEMQIDEEEEIKSNYEE